MGSFHTLKATAARQQSELTISSQVPYSNRFGLVVPRDMEARKRMPTSINISDTDVTVERIQRAISGNKDIFPGQPVMEPRGKTRFSLGETEALRLATERQHRIAAEQARRRNGQGECQRNPVPGAFGKGKERDI